MGHDRKILDYILGSKFTVYIGNSPFLYVKESKLGLAQIRCLSKLVRFDFNIMYKTAKSNNVEDALSQCHLLLNKEDIVTESEEYETISYVTYMMS